MREAVIASILSSVLFSPSDARIRVGNSSTRAWLPKFISRDTIRGADAIPAGAGGCRSVHARNRFPLLRQSACSPSRDDRRRPEAVYRRLRRRRELCVAAPAKAECSRTLLSFGPGIESYAAQMQVEKGGGCNIEVGGRWSKRQLVDNLEGVSVVKRPSHGQAGGRSANQLAYKPDPNYVGRDEFSVLVKFVAHGVAGATRLDITVDVVDHL